MAHSFTLGVPVFVQEASDKPWWPGQVEKQIAPGYFEIHLLNTTNSRVFQQNKIKEWSEIATFTECFDHIIDYPEHDNFKCFSQACLAGQVIAKDLAKLIHEKNTAEALEEIEREAQRVQARLKGKSHDGRKQDPEGQKCILSPGDTIQYINDAQKHGGNMQLCQTVVSQIYDEFEISFGNQKYHPVSVEDASANIDMQTALNV